MAEIAHTFVRQTTAQTTTSNTYQDVSGASIASGALTVGHKYLILVSAQYASGSNAAERRVRFLHGSTAFDESESVYNGGVNGFRAYNWFTVWTAVSSEGLKLQLKSNGSATATVDCISIIAIDLTELTENTDWFFNERATDDGLSTTPVDGASITAVGAGEKWLALSYARQTPGDNTTQVISELNRSGEASSTDPKSQFEANSTTLDIVLMFQSRLFTFTGSNTIKEISSASSGTAHVRAHSAVFAINLGKFVNADGVYTAADVALSATDFATQIQTLSFTPSQVGDVVVGCSMGFDVGAAGRTMEFRLQVDDADDPAGQTTDDRLFGSRDTADEPPQGLMTILDDLSAAAHTFDVDGSVDNAASTPGAQHRSLWAFALELVPAVVANDALVVIRKA